jgi:hypothetical protein
MSPPCIEKNENTGELLHNLGIFNERNQSLRGANGARTGSALVVMRGLAKNGVTIDLHHGPPAVRGLYRQPGSPVHHYRLLQSLRSFAMTGGLGSGEWKSGRMEEWTIDDGRLAFARWKVGTFERLAHTRAESTAGTIRNARTTDLDPIDPALLPIRLGSETSSRRCWHPPKSDNANRSHPPCYEMQLSSSPGCLEKRREVNAFSEHRTWPTKPA